MVDSGFRNALGRFLSQQEKEALPPGVTRKDESFVSYTSEAIRGVSWIDRTMVVDFTSGARYIYWGVPYNEYEGFFQALSRGQYFVFEVRNNYPYMRI